MTKRLSLMTELVPEARRYAVLMNPRVPNPWMRGFEETARAKGVQLLILEAGTKDEIDAAFVKMVQERTEALVIGEDTFLSGRPEITDLALRNRIPTMGLLRGFAEIGGLATYGTSLTEAYRLVGALAGRILRGAKPGDLAVQRPTKFEMVINLKTAKALGLTISPLMLAQADELIE
jgi:putative ABC transport system substrate-binding protein